MRSVTAQLLLSGLLLPVLMLLGGCEPSRGRVIESVEWTSADRSTLVVSHLHQEGTIGNPAQGEHLRIYCTSSRVKRLRQSYPNLIAQGYYVSKLGHIPKDQVTVLSDDIIYGLVKSQFFITFDGCVTVNSLNADKFEGLRVESLARYGPEEVEGLRARRRIDDVAGHAYFATPTVSLFKATQLCPKGNIVLTVDETYIKDSEPLWVVSEDQAVTWKLVVKKPACS